MRVFLCITKFVGVEFLEIIVSSTNISASSFRLFTKHIYVYILFQIVFPFRLLQNIEQNSLCCTVGPCWLSILNYPLPNLSPLVTISEFVSDLQISLFVSFLFRFCLKMMSYNISLSLTDFIQCDNLYLCLCCCKWHYFILSNGWILFHCIYSTSHYPFLCWWTFRLLPCLGYCKQCCNEHWGAYILSDPVFLWIYVQEWDFRVIW